MSWTIPGLVVLRGAVADVRPLFVSARRHFGRHRARPFALRVGRLRGVDALLVSIERSGPAPTLHPARTAAWLASVARHLGRELVVTWELGHLGRYGERRVDRWWVEHVVPGATRRRSISVEREEALLGVPHAAVTGFWRDLPRTQVLRLDRSFPRAKVARWLSGEAPARRPWARGGLLVACPSPSAVERVREIVRSSLVERGEAVAGRVLRATTFRGLPWWHFDVPFAAGDMTPFEPAESDGVRFRGTTFVDRATGLAERVARALDCEVWTWRTPGRDHTALPWVRHAEPHGDPPARGLGRGLAEVAARVGVSVHAIERLSATLAIELPIDAPVDGRALADYLADALPAPRAVRRDAASAPNHGEQHFELEPWMVREAEGLASRLGIALGDVFSLAWRLGCERAFAHRRALRDRTPLRVRWPPRALPAGLRWSEAAPVPSRPAPQTRVLVALDVEWLVVDLSAELGGQLDEGFSPLLGTAFVAARPALWSLDRVAR